MKKSLIGLSALLMLFLSGCTFTLDPKSTLLHTGQGESLAQLKRSCDMNDGKRCVTLGIKVFWLQDIQSAKKYFEKACDLNVAEGCYNLGILYRNRHLQDKGEGLEYIEKACMMGINGKTVHGAHIVRCEMFLGRYGYGLKDYEMVYPYDKNLPDITNLKKACSLNDSAACVQVGIKYYQGFDGEQDYSEARTYFKKACDLNSGVGCRWVASTYIDNRGWKTKINRPEVIKYNRKACDLNNAQGCYILGLSYVDGRRITKDYSKAMKYLRKACGLNYGLACKKYEELKKEGH